MSWDPPGHIQSRKGQELQQRPERAELPQASGGKGPDT